MGRKHNPITLHKYLYANVDPVNKIDPSGNVTIMGLMQATAVVGTLATTTGVSIRSMAIFGGGGNSSNWTPDMDGKINIGEAAYWWRNGKGTSLTVPLSSINLWRVDLDDFDDKGLLSPNLDLNYIFDPSDAAVYGTITLQLVSKNKVIAVGGGDVFDFDQKSNSSAKLIFRNIATAFAEISIGKGQPFRINLTGEAKID
jgi:hypothetical protein